MALNQRSVRYSLGVILLIIAGILPDTVQGQKFINFTTTGTVRSTLVFGNQIVPDVYLFFAEAGEFIRVETSNSSFDTTLRVVGPDAEFNIFDDDGAANGHSLLRFTAPDTGAYVIIVSSFSGNPGGGLYDLTIARGSAAKHEVSSEPGVGDYLPEVGNPIETKP